MASTTRNKRKHIQVEPQLVYNINEPSNSVIETLSPQAAADEDYRAATMSKRQEQNRAAQRAFRERRAKVLKEMGDRILKLELIIGNVTLQMRRFVELEHEVGRFKNDLKRMQSLVDTAVNANTPTWTIPTSESSEIEEDSENHAHHILILDALRPSSTDPTLISDDFNEN